jgi:uncharacterized protein (UPF0248 family)
MKKLIMLVEIVKAIKEKFELDETDLRILTIVGLADEEKREIHVTDITRMHDIASPRDTSLSCYQRSCRKTHDHNNAKH